MLRDDGRSGAGLDGSQVTGGIYCCQAPTAAYLDTVLVTATVGPEVEFPNGAFRQTGGLVPIPVTIDVGSSTIDNHYNAARVSAGGAFNGYVLDFSGAPMITGVSLNALSTLTPTSLSWDANSVFINVASQRLLLDSRILINVLAVPEPTMSAMMLGGIGLLGFYGWRRGRSPLKGVRRVA
ncbi:MAG: PEP-CTERM sorting domain-containing protein [Bdellovibrionales bacterium]|nr:PEP-CTERM sorting domain-containing protein [Massilia sp.]